MSSRLIAALGAAVVVGIVLGSARELRVAAQDTPHPFRLFGIAC